MALRIRKDGRILCAAIHKMEKGDTYIDDNLHYEMSVVHRVICSEPDEQHMKTGEWWWNGNIPEGSHVISGYIYYDKIERFSDADWAVLDEARELVDELEKLR